MNNNVCHIISHTHWDREWYLPYEKHHVRLVKLMDTLLEVLENNSNYKSFHLDGQTIILEDYLQIKPERKEQISRFIREGRLFVGPWYILQDEYLTSSEANVRNLQIGHHDAKSFGSISKIGYFPDSFGNIGQAPQILRQAGIDTAVFGRGVTPTGFNNQVETSIRFESPFSEMHWQSPDGSSVLGILFANWYNNGMEIPTDTEEAETYWSKRIMDAEKFASTNHLLFMNGCDHQPIQVNLPEAVETAQKLFPKIEFIHSNFADYIYQVKEMVPEYLKTIKGELRSQHTNGWGTLVNTASTRIYLKQKNQVCQTMLEKVAEPLASIATVLGYPYPSHLLSYAWKMLMQNHPHDSICGCSIDEVHQEMVTRFEKCRHVAEEVIDQSLQYIAHKIDTKDLEYLGKEIIPFSVFNTTGWERSGVSSVELEVERFYFRDEDSPQSAAQKARKVSLDGWVLSDDEGNKMPFTLEDLGQQFGYDLPDEKFRQPYMARKVRVTFEAENVPKLGYKVYALLKDNKKEYYEQISLVTGKGKMENDHLKVVISEDGTMTVTDKNNGHTFTDLCVYEDAGDIGNEYMFKQPDGEKMNTTRGLKADIDLLEDTSFHATYRVTHNWEVPAYAEELLEKEINNMVDFSERKSQRVEKKVAFQIITYVTLEKNARSFQIKVKFDNRAKDHRLRVLFPTDIESDTHLADSVFEVVNRDNDPSPEWKNPSNCQHQQAFVSIHNKRAGFTVANKGLNEYEIIRDGRNTIAVTLLRSVAELGDWGVFSTPEAQCLGEQTVEFEIIPHSGDGVISGAFQEAYQYQVPWTTKQLNIQKGELQTKYSLLDWEGKKLALSSVKMQEETNDLMIRWFNMTKEHAKLNVKSDMNFKSFYESNILEEKVGDSIPFESEEFDIKPAEIITLGLN
jgi:alpha-mannosidase